MLIWIPLFDIGFYWTILTIVSYIDFWYYFYNYVNLYWYNYITFKSFTIHFERFSLHFHLIKPKRYSLSILHPYFQFIAFFMFHMICNAKWYLFHDHFIWCIHIPIMLILAMRHCCLIFWGLFVLFYEYYNSHSLGSPLEGKNSISSFYLYHRINFLPLLT